ncbi:MAG: efflux RND transporter periplasmic adaptor subunit [Dissulfuribacterales bacterium]
MYNKGPILSFCSVLCVSILLFFAGCDRKPQQPPQMPSAEVAFITVEAQPLTLTTELPGRTVAHLVAEIRPQVSGILQKRLFVEGADVKDGQVLYLVDSAPFETALRNAKASLAKSEANIPALKAKVQRFQGLIGTGAVSQQNYDDALAALRQGEADVEYWKAQVETARINLGYTKIIAPISGRIGRSNVTEGALVTAYQAQPLAVIQQLSPIYVDVPQSTAELLRLRERLEKGRIKLTEQTRNVVKLRLEDGSEYAETGAFRFQDVTVDKSTGSVTLRMEFPNTKHVLLPGMFVKAVIQEGIKEDAILVPQQAVTRTPKGEPMVMLVNEQGGVEPRIIVVDRPVGDKWHVISGLKPGDRIVFEGIQRIRPGIPIKPVPFKLQEHGPQTQGATEQHGPPGQQPSLKAN